MSDVPRAPTPFADPIPFLEQFARDRDTAFRVANTSPTGLQVKPDLAYYKHLARALHRKMRAADPLAKLTHAHYALARENGFPSWPKFECAILDRNKRARELNEALQRRDALVLKRIVEQDRAAILDVASTASPDDLAALLYFVPADDGEADSNLLAVLLAVIAKQHRTDDLLECVELLLQMGAGFDWASDILQCRLHALPEGITAERDRENIEYVLGQIANYEFCDADFEYLPEDD